MRHAFEKGNSDFKIHNTVSFVRFPGEFLIP